VQNKRSCVRIDEHCSVEIQDHTRKERETKLTSLEHFILRRKTSCQALTKEIGSEGIRISSGRHDWTRNDRAQSKVKQYCVTAVGNLEMRVYVRA